MICKPHSTKLADRSDSLPSGPKDQKRAAHVIGNAVKVMRIATGNEKRRKLKTLWRSR